MLPSILLFAAALAAPFAQGSSVKRTYGCRNDACFKAVAGNFAKPCTAECKSFLKITVTPAVKTVFQTVTTTVTTNSRVPVTAKGTALVTVTQTESVVQTDLESVTLTQTNLETATVTQDVTVTSTTGALPENGPFKRAASTQVNPYECLKSEEKRAVAVAGPVTVRPTKIPSTAKACTNTAAFSSACSCIGVTATTVTAHKPTTTKTVTTTSTRAKPVTVTVKTVTVTSTAKTDVVTTTFSTSIVTTTVQTDEVDLTVATNTVTATSVVQLPPNPVETVRLLAVGSNDPRLATSGGIGFVALESFRGSNYVYYVDFTNDASSNQLFGVNRITGEVTVINGPGIAPGESLSYSSSAQASYVNVAPVDYAANNGGRLSICKIAQGNGYEFLQCKWGDNQIADFWTCASRLNFVQPGFDFTSQCNDASTSYKIPILQVQRV